MMTAEVTVLEGLMHIKSQINSKTIVTSEKINGLSKYLYLKWLSDLTYRECHKHHFFNIDEKKINVYDIVYMIT